MLANILEDVTGKSFEESLEDRICKPLGLTDTVMSLSDEQTERRMVAYTKKKEPIPLLSVLQTTHQKQANGSKKNFEMGTWTDGTTVGFHSYAGFIKKLSLGVTVLS